MSKWETEQIGNLCTVLNGFAFKSEKYVDEGLRVIRITNVQKGYIEDDAPQFYPIEEERALKKYHLFEGDLLISLTGNVGRVAILEDSYLPAVLNQRVGCIRIKTPNKLSKKFLYSFLNSDLFETRCIESAKGVAQKNMSTEWLKQYEFPLPPLAEQQKIADELDKISDLIAKRKQQLDKLDLLVKAKFVEMFGNPVENPMGWEMQELDKLGDLNRGMSKHRPRNDPALLGGDYPLIQTGGVSNAGLYITEYVNTYSELGLKQSKMWKNGTLCITIAANIAKTAILTFDACFPDSVVGFLANQSTNEVFIHYWFGFFQKLLEAQAPESAQKNINLKILKELQVITPPLALQTQFADYVQSVEKTKSKMEQGLAELEQLYRERMQEYFE